MQELEAGGRVVELEAALADAQEKLEKATGKRAARRFRGVVPLVNVQALQSDKERLQNFIDAIKLERDDLATKVASNQAQTDFLEDEIFGLKERPVAFVYQHRRRAPHFAIVSQIWSSPSGSTPAVPIACKTGACA